MSKVIMVVDLKGMKFDLRLMLSCLQGLANRQNPEIYFVDTDDKGEGESIILDWLIKEKGYQEKRYKTGWEFFEEYKDLIKGMIIADPLKQASYYAAVCLASLENAVVVTPDLAKQVNLKVIADFQNRWEYDIEVLEWMVEHLLKRCNKKCFSFFLQGPTVNVPSEKFPPDCADYLVKFKVFPAFLRISVANHPPFVIIRKRERKVAQKIFQYYSPNTPALININDAICEHTSVHFLSEYGIIPQACGNLNFSIHSGYPGEYSFKQEKIKFGSLEKKVYLTCILSDGDNLAAIGKKARQFWPDQNRGKLPLAWNQGPFGYDLIPDVLEYFYSTSTLNDYQVMGCSGAGYIDPKVFGKRLGKKQPEVYREFLRITKRYMDKLDLREIWPLKTSIKSNLKFAQGLPGLRGLFVNFQSARTFRGSHYEVNGIPVFLPVVGPWADEEDLGDNRFIQTEYLLKEIKRKTPRQRAAFLFAGLNGWTATSTQVLELAKKLGDEYKIVRPDEFLYLYRKWKDGVLF